MAKNRNKKKRDAADSMDTTELPVSVSSQLQAMDTSESGAQKSISGSQIRKVKKGKQMKRTKSVRKMKAIAKAISLNEKCSEKITKNESKTSRTKSAKLLYD